MSKRLHFIGIGGIGMSALARYYKNKGYEISGSDNEDSELISELKKEGMNVMIGHSSAVIPDLIRDPEIEQGIDSRFRGNDTISNRNDIIFKVFYTEAIPESNPELKKAREIGIPCLTYFEGLGEISKETKCIAISGSHGKSTTTSMIGIIMQELGLRPNVIVGTRVPNFGNKNFLAGDGDYLIVEACEYRESFLHLNVYGAVITNIEADHLDYYKNEENYIEGFKKFVSKIPQNGFLVLNKDDKNSQKIKNFAKCEIIEVSKNDEELKLIPEFETPGEHVRFDGLMAFKTVEKLLKSYKVENHSIIASELNVGHCEERGTNDEAIQCLELGKINNGQILGGRIVKALKSFKGTWRRFEFLGELNGVKVFSDYGHHPTEISVTLKGAKDRFKGKKIICVFEPHQYSRTIELFDGFCKSFSDCDQVIIPSIYKVRDKQEDIARMSPKILAEGINKYSNNAISIDCDLETKHASSLLGNWLNENLQGDEILIFIGAGPIDNVARKLVGNS